MASTLTVDQLTALAREVAAAPQEWVERVRLNSRQRWYERLEFQDDYEIWLLSWLPGQSTGLHDHGGSHGAFAVALGSLEENDLRTTRRLAAGQARGFGPEHVHEVSNASDAPAVSVHVYSPPLTVMNRFDLTEAGLVPLIQETADQW